MPETALSTAQSTARSTGSQRRSASLRRWAVLVGGLVALFVLGVYTISNWTVVHDWRDDHSRINELEVLGPNDLDLWWLLLETPAEQVDCNVAICQNVLRVLHYEAQGDFDAVRVAAYEQILRNWVPVRDHAETRDIDPLVLDSILFEYRLDVDTTTGTAYLRLTFDPDAQLPTGAFRPIVVAALSSQLPV